MWLEIVTISSLLMSVKTGIQTIGRNQDYFSKFSMADVATLRLDALLYILVMFSTALSLVDIAARITWACTVGWDRIDGGPWQQIWLWLHIAIAFSWCGMHVLVGRMLDNKDFCALCQRPWKTSDAHPK